MSIESSNDPQGFGNFEHNGWETVSRGYEEHPPGRCDFYGFTGLK